LTPRKGQRVTERVTVAMVSIDLGPGPRLGSAVDTWAKLFRASSKSLDFTRLSKVTGFLKAQGNLLKHIQQNNPAEAELKAAAQAIGQEIKEFLNTWQESMLSTAQCPGKTIEAPVDLAGCLGGALGAFERSWNEIRCKAMTGTQDERLGKIPLFMDEVRDQLVGDLARVVETLRISSPGLVQYPESILRAQTRLAEISDGTAAVQVHELADHLKDQLAGMQQLSTNETVELLASETRLARRAVELGTGGDKRTAMFGFYQHTALLMDAVKLWNATSNEVEPVLSALDCAIGAWQDRMDKHGSGQRVSEQQADFRAELMQHWRETGVLTAQGQ